MSDRAEPGTLSSVNRALSLVELLAENNGLSLTQLARRLDIGKATAFRLTKTLTDRGWVEKDAELRYRLGPGLLSLAGDASGGELCGPLRPLMEDLQEETGETIHLTVLRGRYIMYIDQLISPKPVHSVSTLGSRSPAHCVSPGLAQLALVPREQLDWVLSAPLQRYTERSPQTSKAVHAELEMVRERGYAINRGAFRAEVGGVGAAITNRHGRPVAALSVCMPAFRMHSTDLDAVGKLLTRTVADASQRVELTQRPTY